MLNYSWNYFQLGVTLVSMMDAVGRCLERGNAMFKAQVGPMGGLFPRPFLARAIPPSPLPFFPSSATHWGIDAEAMGHPNINDPEGYCRKGRGACGGKLRASPSSL